jgi:frataxin-like iron-binding protein CyaY
MENILKVEELIALNEMMLGRGVPVQNDGIGYSKPDYGACSNYYNGMSDAQIADLAKRLVKYSKTQLNIDKAIMDETAKYYASLVSNVFTREDGVSIDIKENETMICFKYNEKFVWVVKGQSGRRYDAENKQWAVPNSAVIKTLNALRKVGADVENALALAEDSKAINKSNNSKKMVEVKTKLDEEYAMLKFDYNEDVVSAIKQIDKKDRKWNPDYKFWSIKINHYHEIKNRLSDVATFEIV